MNCNDAIARLYRFIDGEMSLVRRIRLSVHLRRCPPCADGVEFERELRIRIAGGCVDPFPQDLRDRLVAFLGQLETDGLEAGGTAAMPSSGG